jgi:N-acetylglutamate synthase-like GNAT family acetyltransferase
MTIRKFVKELHLQTLQLIMARRGVHIPYAEEIPEIGFIVYDFETPVAVSFLRRCEGKFGQIDGVASNPDCTSQQRHKALDMAIAHCIETAQHLGITQLISITKDKPTLERAIRNGFEELPEYTVSILNNQR